MPHMYYLHCYDYDNNMWWRVPVTKLTTQSSTSLYSHLPPTPDILLSQTLNLCSSLDIRHQISHPHKMTATMSVCISVHATFWTEWQQVLPEFILLFFFHVHGPQFLSRFNIYETRLPTKWQQHCTSDVTQNINCLRFYNKNCSKSILHNINFA